MFCPVPCNCNLKLTQLALSNHPSISIRSSTTYCRFDLPSICSAQFFLYYLLHIQILIQQIFHLLRVWTLQHCYLQYYQINSKSFWYYSFIAFFIIVLFNFITYVLITSLHFSSCTYLYVRTKLVFPMEYGHCARCGGKKKKKKKSDFL